METEEKTQKQVSNKVQYEPMYGYQIANLLGVSYHSLVRWMEPHKETIGERNGYVYTAKQVKKIVELFS